MATEKYKMPSAGDLRALSETDLESRLVAEQKAYTAARFDHSAAALVRTSDLKARRRSIARIQTILSEKKQRG